MGITGLGGVLLNVSDPARSRRFYGELLGLRLSMEPDDHTAVYDLGDTSLVIHGHGEYDGSTAPGSEDAGATILFL